MTVLASYIFCFLGICSTALGAFSWAVGMFTMVCSSRVVQRAGFISAQFQVVAVH